MMGKRKTTRKLVGGVEPVDSLLYNAKRDVRVTWNEGETWFTAAYVEQDRWNGWACPWFTEAEGRRIATTRTTPEVDDVIEYHPERPLAERFTHINPTYPDEPFTVNATPDPERPGEYVYGIGNGSWIWWDEGEDE